jgi:hypothetical protein
LAKLSFKYSDLLQLIGGYAVSQRTESRQFLAWFLNNYYRLEEGDVDDAICDGHDDKTVDGIWVNEQSNEIHIFQAKIAKGPKSLGDVALKEFYGSLAQFGNRQAVETLLSTTRNMELAKLLKDLDIAGKVSAGYAVKGVFITNSERDHNAKAFLQSAPNLVLYDEQELHRSYVHVDKTDPISKQISFDVSGVPTLEYPITNSVKMAIAPISAFELLKMEGIKNGELFSYNVRQSLKKTKVNIDIANSIKQQDQHTLFPAFHNGVAILCERLEVSKEKITISGYAVVNGCQSLTGLHDNKDKVTSDLRILTKFVQTPPDGKLAATITDHTNNQNGTTARDLQSNTMVQTKLQTEINAKGEFNYRIKRGEHPEWNTAKVIENDLAARILLAYDLKEPWSCHQTYKLFDELHGSIFGRPEVKGDRIVIQYRMFEIIMSKLSVIHNQLFAKYRLTHFLLLYLLRRMLETDPLGKRFCSNPSPFISTQKDREHLLSCIEKIVQVMMRIVNGEVRRREAETEKDKTKFFDFKRELKSPNAVRSLEATIVTHYEVMTDSDMAITFEKAWNSKKKEVKK